MNKQNMVLCGLLFVALQISTVYGMINSDEGVKKNDIPNKQFLKQQIKELKDEIKKLKEEVINYVVKSIDYSSSEKNVKREIEKKFKQYIERFKEENKFYLLLQDFLTINNCRYNSRHNFKHYKNVQELVALLYDSVEKMEIKLSDKRQFLKKEYQEFTKEFPDIEEILKVFKNELGEFKEKLEERANSVYGYKILLDARRFGAKGEKFKSALKKTQTKISRFMWFKSLLGINWIVRLIVGSYANWRLSEVKRLASNPIFKVPLFKKCIDNVIADIAMKKRILLYPELYVNCLDLYKSFEEKYYSSQKNIRAFN